MTLSRVIGAGEELLDILSQALRLPARQREKTKPEEQAARLRQNTAFWTPIFPSETVPDLNPADVRDVISGVGLLHKHSFSGAAVQDFPALTPGFIVFRFSVESFFYIL